MGFIKRSKNLSVCFALGIFCFSYGFARSYVEDIVTPLELALFLISFACLATCLVSAGLAHPKSFSKQNIRDKNSLAKSFILAFLLFIAVNWAGAHYPFSFDVTKFKQHTLSAQTMSVVKTIGVPIRMTALHVGLPPKYLEDLLKEYAKVSEGRISFEIIDPLEKIGYAAQFGQIIKGKEKKLIIQTADARQDVDFTDEILNEELINNGLIRVTRKARRACFLTGHGEYRLFDKGEAGLNTLAKMLAANNIFPGEFSITLTGAIPPTCNVIIAAGPREHYNEKEERIINDSLARGGDALFLIENTVITTPDVPLKEEDLEKNPSLNNILAHWGLRVNPDIVVDVSSHAAGDAGSPATRNYPQHKAIVSHLDYTFYVRPRSISIVPERRKGLKVAPLVLTASTESSWGETNRMLDVKFDEVLDRPGPIPIAFVVWEEKEADDSSDTRIAVFTDADFCSNAYIDQVSNAQMALNVINWLSESDYQTFNIQKTMDVKEIHLISRQKRMIVVILWLIPIAIATLGMMRWLRQNV